MHFLIPLRLRSAVALLAGLGLATLTPTLALAGNGLAGNGFPSGPHFNLNVLGKKADFVCPSPEDYRLGTPDQNVIYVPRTGSDIEILMESGRKGPKSSPDQATLQVTDWCSETFDSDAAALQLPKNADGYAVYARILGKPGHNDGGTGLPTFQFTDRTIVLAEDEFGNDLLGLGLITNEGLVDFDGHALERWDTSRKGKGAKKATDITALFLFNGAVCAINDQDAFCAGGGCADGTPLCCLAVEDDGAEGLQVASACNDPDPLGFVSCTPLIDDGFGGLTCPDELEFDGVLTGPVCEVVPQCKTFVNEWIFNIADFVNVLFGADNNGSYNVQIRFYPLPLINGQ